MNLKALLFIFGQGHANLHVSSYSSIPSAKPNETGHTHKVALVMFCYAIRFPRLPVV